MKRVILAHCWDGFPEYCWYPWLKQQLEVKGLEVIIPALPNTEEPRIHTWVPALKEISGEIDSDTYFVGHSMGVQSIARLLADLPEGTQVGGAIFVAGFFKGLTGLEDDFVVKDVVHHWLSSPVDLSKVATHLRKSVAIFSDDDPYVPLDNQDDFKDFLHSDIIIQSVQGHFSGDDYKELPIVLEKLTEMIQD